MSRTMRERLICCTAVFVCLAVLQAFSAKAAYAKTPDGKPLVVSLGDSFSSGEGVEPFYDQNAKEPKEPFVAHRSKKSWPGKLRVPTTTGESLLLSDYYEGNKEKCWYFRAASGAKIEHLEGPYPKTLNASIYGTNEFSIQPQYKVFEEIKKSGGSVDYVTMTMSGNDVGFTDVIGTAAGSCAWIDPGTLTAKLIKAQITFDNTVKAKLRDEYKKISNKTGSGTNIIIAGYPQLFDVGTALARPALAFYSPWTLMDYDAAINFGLPVNILFDPCEMYLINDRITHFNSGIQAVVESVDRDEDMKARIHFVSVEEEFDGHGAYSVVPYINGVHLLKHAQDIQEKEWDVFPSSYSIHPNDWGTSAYARAVQRTIDDIERQKSESTDASEETEPEPAPEPAPAPEPTDPFMPVILQYRDVANSDWSDEAITTYPTIAEQAKRVSAGYRASRGEPPTILYALRDINGDGTNELILACAGTDVGVFSKDYCIFDIWTSSDSGAVLTATMRDVVGPGADLGHGMYGYIPCVDGCVAVRQGKTNSDEYYYRIPEGGGNAQYVEGWERLRIGNGPDRSFSYYAIDAGGNKTQISEQEWQAMRDRHGLSTDTRVEGNYTIDFQPIQSYGS